MEALVYTFSSVGTLGIIFLATSSRDPPKVPSKEVPSKGKK
uniref:Photosystem II subunit n=1 Tax=Phaeoceros carolinianus TaxID=185665 RepID=F6KK77_9EMBR|nr:photosystem II subunit [Phaeoceros carolinianus]